MSVVGVAVKEPLLSSRDANVTSGMAPRWSDRDLQMFPKSVFQNKMLKYKTKGETPSETERQQHF